MKNKKIIINNFILEKKLILNFFIKYKNAIDDIIVKKGIINKNSLILS